MITSLGLKVSLKVKVVQTKGSNHIGRNLGKVVLVDKLFQRSPRFRCVRGP